MAKTSAYQLQKTDIRVNTVCPGLIETGMTDVTFEYARRRGTMGKIGQLNPLGRFGVPEGIILWNLGIIAALTIHNHQKLPMPFFFWHLVALFVSIGVILC